MSSGLLGALLPYQQKWLLDKSPVKIYEKSRRIGISWCQALDAVLTAAADKGGMDVWYIGYNKDMALEFIRDSAFWAKNANEAAKDEGELLIRDEDKDILSYRIRFASGHRITALSSRPSNLRGKQGLVIIDEAAFHDDLPGLLKAAMALLIWGGRVVVVSTHFGVDNAFADLIENIHKGKSSYSLHRTTFAQALEAGLYQRICAVSGQDWSAAKEESWRADLYDFYGQTAAEELDCIPSSRGGAYLSRALIESRMSTAGLVLRLSQPDGFALQPDKLREMAISEWIAEHLQPILSGLDPNLNHCYGMDFGRNGDLSVIAVYQLTKSLARPVPLIVELRNIPFKQQEQLLFYLVDNLPCFLAGAMDARGNGQYLAEVAVQRYGQRVEAVMLSQQWYRDNMPKFKAGLEDGEISLPKDADVLLDLRCLEMQKGIAKIPETKKYKGSDGLPRHGDSAIALALGYYATQMEVEVFEYTPVRPQEHGEDPVERPVKITGGFKLHKGCW